MVSKKTNWIVLYFLAIVGLLAASCAPAAAPPPQKAATPAASEAQPTKVIASPTAPATTPKPSGDQPKYGGTLNIGHFGDPLTYDPIQETSVTSVSLLSPIYSGMVQHDPLEPTKVIGDLAEKWDMGSDGMSYTFYLYKNIKWQDGAPFTSEDARYTLELVRQPPRGVISARQEWVKAIDKMETPDKETLKVILQYPSASFLHNLGDGRLVIVPKHVVEARGNMKRDVVGTGAYKLKSHVPGISWSVVKNPDYFVKGRPYLDMITWYIVPDVATRFAALRTHRVQVTPWASQGLTPLQAEIIQKELSDKIAVDDYPSLMFFGFWMPYNKPPWNDKRVRRAVDIAIDRQKEIKVGVEGAGVVGSYMPPGTWGLPQEEIARMPGYRQPKDADIAEAKKLLAEAGYPSGFKTTTIARNVKYQERGAICLKDQLAQIGIEMTVSLRDQATLNDLLYKRAFDSAVQGAAAAYDDPDQILGQQLTTGVPRNFGDFSDEQIDRWYDEQGRTMDPAKRKQIVYDIQRRLMELVPYSVVHWQLYQLGRWKEVKDFKAGIGVYNNLKFQNVWLAQ